MAVRGLDVLYGSGLPQSEGRCTASRRIHQGLPAEVVMADTAYDADHLRQAIAAKRAIAVIPNNPSRALKHPLDKDLYAQRYLVECCFSKLKQFRRVATRFEKTAEIIVPSSPSQQSSYGWAPNSSLLHARLIFFSASLNRCPLRITLSSRPFRRLRTECRRPCRCCGRRRPPPPAAARSWPGCWSRSRRRHRRSRSCRHRRRCGHRAWSGSS